MLVFAYVLKEKKSVETVRFPKKNKKTKKQKNKIRQSSVLPEEGKSAFAKNFGAFLVSMSTDIVCIYIWRREEAELM